MEPRGCPTPGACSALAYIAALRRLVQEMRFATHIEYIYKSQTLMNALAAAEAVLEPEK